MAQDPQSSSAESYSDVEKHNDIKVLHGMGYAQELERRMSRFSNFAISFSIICILSGGINSLAQGLSGVGGAADRHRLAARLPGLRRLRGRHGADRLGLSDRRRPLSLGLDPGQPRLRAGSPPGST